MITVGVELGERRYDVVVGEDCRLDLAAHFPPGAQRVALVTQQAVVEAGCLNGIDLDLPAGTVLIGDGERAKSLDTVETLCRNFASGGLSRRDVVVAVGGGVVTDVAGFAAASYHRGMPYVNVPTTLLAQVDAAIGGKTGVNLPEGKNLVGAFWQPTAVLCDTAVLASLPAEETASGRGEMAKYAFLCPGEPDDSLLGLSLDQQVARCVAIKAEVVAADEREGDRRMVLNYGHTLAHALEAAGFVATGGPDPGGRPSPAGRSGGRDPGAMGLRHGEAVAVGLVFAALLARRLGRIDDDRVALHRQVVAGFGLPASLPAGSNPEVLVALMGRDKKAHHDLTFVLDGPRGVEAVPGVAAAEVMATLAEMGADR